MAAASFGAALFSEPTARGFTSYGPPISDVFGRPTSLSWSSDDGFLIATIVFGVVAVLAFLAAARVSANAARSRS
jgi:hypothetical protein